MELVKAILLHAAYQGAAAVCAGVAIPDGQPLPLDPTIQDAGLRDKGVLVYELAKVQYHAILRAFHDQSGVWPDPQVVSGIDVPALLGQALKLLPQLGPILDLIKK